MLFALCGASTLNFSTFKLFNINQITAYPNNQLQDSYVQLRRRNALRLYNTLLMRVYVNTDSVKQALLPNTDYRILNTETRLAKPDEFATSGSNHVVSEAGQR